LRPTGSGMVGPKGPLTIWVGPKGPLTSWVGPKGPLTIWVGPKGPLTLVQQVFSLLDPLAQHACTGEVRQQKLHLVSQDTATLQVE